MRLFFDKLIKYLKSFEALKSLVWRARIAFNGVTQSQRDLPSFIIIGAQKAGTTSLFSHLSQHPELLPSIKKEIHFFDGGRQPWKEGDSKAETWYRAQFPFQWSKKNRKKTFEASPFYLFNPNTPGRIHAWMPNVKLIALLRNPSERAVSHYFHESRKGREKLEMQAAFEAEESRIEQAVASADFESFPYKKCSYKTRGCYKDQLKRYFDLFGREQVLVLCSEDFFANPAQCLKDVYRFLGISEDFEIKDLAPANVAGNRTDVDQETYRYLDSYFEPHNEALFEFLGVRYPWSRNRET
ncbi:MAG: sulfotransferase domain-containing protein [Pseudomonadota bacterium]